MGPVGLVSGLSAAFLVIRRPSLRAQECIPGVRFLGRSEARLQTFRGRPTPWRVLVHVRADWIEPVARSFMTDPSSPLATVLLVDDDPVIAMMYGLGLERAGYQVVVAKDGQ